MANSQHLQLSEEDAIALLNAWSFLEILKVQPTNQGTVNTTFFCRDTSRKILFTIIQRFYNYCTNSLRTFIASVLGIM
jgi:hypothetical protein